MGEGRKLTAEEFAELFKEQARRLRRSAYLLCGDWQRAEDLVQTTFAKVYAARRRVRAPATLPAYLRRTLTHTYLDEARRRWRGERPVDEVPDNPDPRHGDSGAEDRLALLEALGSLPIRQRACLVLRFYEDCSVEETAVILDCPVGTVKSDTSRGLAALRERLGNPAAGAGLREGSRPAAPADDLSTTVLKETRP